MSRKLSRSRSPRRTLKHPFFIYHVSSYLKYSLKKEEENKEIFSFEIHYGILLIYLVDLTLLRLCIHHYIS